MKSLKSMSDKCFDAICTEEDSTEEILKPHIKDCLKVNGKRRIMILKQAE